MKEIRIRYDDNTPESEVIKYLPAIFDNPKFDYKAKKGIGIDNHTMLEFNNKWAGLFYKTKLGYSVVIRRPLRDYLQ